MSDVLSALQVLQLQELDPCDFKCIVNPEIGELGCGLHSSVRMADHRTFGWVAIKCFIITGGAPQKRRLEKKLKKELQVLQQAMNNHIVRIFGWVKWPGSMGLVMEYMPGGNLGQFVGDDSDRLPMKVILRMGCETSDGIAYMHNLPTDQRVVHGDLKPENVLLSSDLHCKMGDFGCAQLIALTGSTITATDRPPKPDMTLAYAAPEKLKNFNIRPKKEQDTYSFGMLLYVLLTGSSPYQHRSQEITFVELIKQGERPDTTPIDELKETLNNEDKQILETLQSIMEKCWQQDPSDRPTMIEVRDELQRLLRLQNNAEILKEVVEVLDTLFISIPNADELQLLPLHFFSSIHGTFIQGNVHNVYNMPDVRQVAIECGTVEFQHAEAANDAEQQERQQTITTEANDLRSSAETSTKRSLKVDEKVGAQQDVERSYQDVSEAPRISFFSRLRSFFEEPEASASSSKSAVNTSKQQGRQQTAATTKADDRKSNAETSTRMSLEVDKKETSVKEKAGPTSSTKDECLFPARAGIVHNTYNLSNLQQAAIACEETTFDRSETDTSCPKCKEAMSCPSCNHCDLFFQDYKLDKLLATGAPGAKVHLCKRKGGKMLAAKIMDPTIYKVAYKERRVWKHVDECLNIVGYHGYCKWKDRIVLIMQLCGGNVDQWLSCSQCERGSKLYQDVKPIDQENGAPIPTDFLDFFTLSTVDILRQTVNGIQYLHSRDIVHRDIKPGNLLLFKSNNKTIVKVSDFGLSRKLLSEESQCYTDSAGTNSFMAPEYCVKKGVKIIPSKMADIFSLGLCCYYILTKGCHIYGCDEDMHRPRIRTKTKMALNDLLPTYDDVPSKSRPDINKNEDLTDEQRVSACHLLRWMLEFDPKKRPEIEEVKLHPTLWNGLKKVELIKDVVEHLRKCHPKRKDKTDSSDELFNWYDMDLVKDDEYEKNNVEAKRKRKNYLSDSAITDKDKVRFEVNMKKCVPEVLHERKDAKNCSDLRDLYQLARNVSVHRLQQDPQIQTALSIVPGEEDWDEFLQAFFCNVSGAHLINSYIFLTNDRIKNT